MNIELEPQEVMDIDWRNERGQEYEQRLEDCNE